MGLFDSFKPAKQQITEPIFTKMYGFGIDLGGVYTENNNIRCYAKSASLATIVNKRMQYVPNARFYITDKTGKVIENHPILDLINKPNNYQSRNEFLKSYTFFCTLYGFSNIYIPMPTNLMPNFMEVLNNNFLTYEDFKILTILEKNEQYKSSVKIRYNANGVNEILTNDWVLPVFDTANNISVNNETPNPFTAFSRIEAIRQSISNDINISAGHGTLISRPGGAGFVSPSDTNPMATAPWNSSEKEEVQKSLNNEAGIINKIGRWLRATNVSLKYTDIQPNYNKFEFDRINKVEESKIFNAYGFPVELAGENTTYANKLQAELQYYNNEIIPFTNNLVQGFNQFFEKWLKGAKINASYDHLSVFAEAKKANLEAFTKAVESVTKAIASGIYTVEQGKQIIDNFAKIQINGK